MADVRENTPELWTNLIPTPKANDHKYTRGQVIVLGGDEMTGAACLTADAAARAGAGLVTILVQPRSLIQLLVHSEPDPLTVYQSFRPYIIARRASDICLSLDKARAKGMVVGVIGPGLGNKTYDYVRDVILDALYKGERIPLIIDADGLNAFIDNYENKKLCMATHAQTVLTPHEGEFKRIFPHLVETLEQDRRAAAMQAVKLLSDGVLVLKGSETIIAQAENGNERMLINRVASPYLATAGSGDVLAGLIAGLIAQGTPAFEAAAAAVWIHGRTAQKLGRGLVSEDLIKNIPAVLKEILGI